MTALSCNTVLMADDDPDDRQLAEDALREVSDTSRLRTVNDGAELLDYLRGTGAYEHSRPDRPDLILLDVQMPGGGGFATLRELKSDPDLASIPVVVFSTSSRLEDVTRSYQLGGSSFVTKPDTFTALVDVMATLRKYWFETVALPA